MRPSRPTFPEGTSLLSVWRSGNTCAAGLVRSCSRHGFAGILLVDTPGTIDATARGDTKSITSLERGYDFLQAVSWFAERADVVLLFFDPNNPGMCVNSAAAVA